MADQLDAKICNYCNKVLPLLAPNKEQTKLFKEFKKDLGKNAKYCAGCLLRADKKIAHRKRKAAERTQSSNSSDENKAEYANVFSLVSSKTTIDLSTDQNQNGKNGSNGSNDRQSSQTSPRKRLAEFDEDSEQSDEDGAQPLRLWLPANRAAKRSKANERSKDDQSPGDTHKSLSTISPLTFDGDDEGVNKTTGGRTGAPGGGPPDSDDDPSDADAENSISTPENPISSDNRISGSAPSQKHVAYREPAPTKAYTAEEELQMQSPGYRSSAVGRYRRSNGG